MFVKYALGGFSNRVKFQAYTCIYVLYLFHIFICLIFVKSKSCNTQELELLGNTNNTFPELHNIIEKLFPEKKLQKKTNLERQNNTQTKISPHSKHVNSISFKFVNTVAVDEYAYCNEMICNRLTITKRIHFAKLATAPKEE